jgi:hypothetical protein
VRFDKAEDLREFLVSETGPESARMIMETWQKQKPNIPHEVHVNGIPKVVTWHVYMTLEEA